MKVERPATAPSPSSGEVGTARPQPQASIRPWASAVGHRNTEEAQLLLPFRDYFKPPPPNFGLPPETRASFDVYEAQAIFRIYWDADPHMSMDALRELVETHPDFLRAGRQGLPMGVARQPRSVTQHQLEQLFKKFPASFPWAWEKRTYVATSYALVTAAIESPPTASASDVAQRMRSRHVGAAGARLVRQWVTERWPNDLDNLKFLRLLPRDANGKPELRGIGPEVVVHRAGSRLHLSEALAKHIDELGRSPEVKYGWSQDDFLAYLTAKLGEPFSEDNYESLLDAQRKGRFPRGTLQPWTTYKREAMRRFSELVTELFDKKIRSRSEMSRVLERSHGYPKVELHTYEYVGRYFAMPNFKAGKADQSKEEAEKLWKHLEGKPQSEHLALARAQGLDEERARYLIGLVRTLHPESRDKPKATRNAWTSEETFQVWAVLESLPIGARRGDVVRELRHRHPELVQRHDLTRASQLNYVLQRHLHVAGLSAFNQSRLADFLHDTALSNDRPKDIPDLIARARAAHPIAYSDVTINDFLREWSKKPAPEMVVHLVDAAGLLPWETLAPPRYGPILRRFAAHFPSESRATPAATELIRTAEMRLLHSLYWSMPPQTTLDDLLASARAQRPRAFDGLTSKKLEELMAAQPQCFPWPIDERNLNVFAMLLVEALRIADLGDGAADVIPRLQAQHPGFPKQTSLEAAGRTRWLNGIALPFLRGLARNGKGHILLAADRMGPLLPLHRPPVRTLETAQHVRELCSREDVNYDWSADQLRRWLSAELRGKVTAEWLATMRKEFRGIMPEASEVRNQARANLAKRIRELHADGYRDVGALLDELHERYHHVRYDESILSSLRSSLGAGAVPSFRLAQAQTTREQARIFLDAICESPGDNIYDIAIGLGLTRSEARYRLDIIETYWSEELQRASPPLPYDEEDRLAMKDALECAPIFATVQEVHDLLKERNPRFFERHPITSTSGLQGVYERELGLKWRESHHQRFREIVASVAKRSGAGYSLRELFSVVSYEFDVRLSLGRFRELARHWKKHPKSAPELQPLRDAAGRFPWERCRTPITRELAARLGSMLADRDDLSVEACVKLLQADSQFRNAYPDVDAATVGFAREAFPGLFPARTDIGVATDELISSGALSAIAARIAALATEHPDPRKLSPRALAEALGLEEREVTLALHRYSTMFPWSCTAQRDGIDITLAAHICLALEAADPREPLSTIAERLNRDPLLAKTYPNIDETLIERTAGHYPDLVPSKAVRAHLFASRLLCRALGTAAKGTKLETVLASLEQQWPGLFSNRPKEFWTSTWERYPTLYAFTECLGGPFGAKLEGLGAPHLVEAASEPNPTASRIARESREIPERLKMCEEFAATIKGKPFENCELVAVQHMLGGQVPFFDILRKLGLDPSRATLVAVPYSVSETAVDVLTDRRWEVRAPPLESDPETDFFQLRETIRTALYERLAAALKVPGRRVVVMDDGGMVAELLASDPFLRDHAHLFSIVEQTRRGITVAEKHELLASVVNAAQALGKVLEGHLIGENLGAKLMLRLARIGVTSLKDVRVGVIGNGVVGWPLAEELRAMGAIVTVRDTDGTAQKAAIEAGFGDGTDKAAFFGGQELILGATGDRSVGPDELALLADGTILASGTSKLVEFDMATIYRMAHEQGGQLTILDAKSRPPTIEVTFPDGRSFVVLASGFPLNFDGGINNLSPQKVELTHLLMLIGAAQCVNVRVAGFHGLMLEPQRRGLQSFAELDEVKQSEKLQEQIRLTDLRLSEAIAGQRRADVYLKKRWPVGTRN